MDIKGSSNTVMWSLSVNIVDENTAYPSFMRLFY